MFPVILKCDLRPLEVSTGSAVSAEMFTHQCIMLTEQYQQYIHYTPGSMGKLFHVMFGNASVLALGEGAQSY